MSSRFSGLTSAVVRSRRSILGLLAAGVIGAAGAAAAIAGPPAFASGSGAPTKTGPPAAGAGVRGSRELSKAPRPGTTAPTSGSLSPVFAAAIARLEHAGTIDSAQERAIDAALASNNYDMQGLVNNGTITYAQAQSVSQALRNIKESAAQTNSAQGQTKKPPVSGNTRR